MTSEDLPLRGAKLIHGLTHRDDRGSFQILVNGETAAQLGVGLPPTQLASAHNVRRGTIRGLHYQVEPFPEHKTLWCTSGEVFDVLVDVREGEPTFGEWVSVHLHAEAGTLHVPPGVAHGYQTLADDSVVNYLIHGTHDRASARTLLWNDPRVGIEWPLPPTVLSENDRNGEPWPPAS